MNEVEIEKTLADLKKEVIDLKSKKRDLWDKFSVIGSVMLPFVIAVVGYLLSENAKKQEQNNNERSIKVTQGQMINLFIGHLTDSNAIKRKLAINTINYVLDSSIARSLVQVVLSTDTNPGVQIQAREFLLATDTATKKNSNDSVPPDDDPVSNLFSKEKEKRVNASNQILTNSTKNEEILMQLLTKVKTCLTGNSRTEDCDNGVYNTMVVLPYFSKSLLIKHKQDILDLVKSIPANKQSTQNQGINLLKKIE